MFFLIGAGNLSEAAMDPGSIAISSFFNLPLVKISCKEPPVSVFHSKNQKDGISQLIGDSAVTFSDGGSWLESLGAWRKPIVLLVKGLPSGEVSGQAAAYFALAKSLKVPVIGLVQLGGNWEPKQRSLDGLPWCGCLLEESDGAKKEYIDNQKVNYPMDIFAIGESIKRRIVQMDLK